MESDVTTWTETKTKVKMEPNHESVIGDLDDAFDELSLSLSCDSSSFGEESSDEREDTGDEASGIIPYRFEPYADSGEELAGDDIDDDVIEHLQESRLEDTTWYGFQRIFSYSIHFQ